MCTLAVLGALASLPAAAATFVAGFHAPEDLRFGALTPTPDGGFAATGLQGYDLTVTKFDAAGTMQWSWSYPGGLGGSIAALSDGSLVVVGAFVMRIDASGLPLWKEALSVPGYDELWLERVAVGPGDDILVGGRTEIWDGEFGEPAGRLLVRLDASGSVLSSSLYDATRSWSAIYDVAFAPDGSVLAAGRDRTTGAWVARLDTTGAVLWQTGVAPLAAGSVAFDVAATPDGGMVVVGDTGASPPQGFVARLDAAGALLWWREAPEWGGWSQVDVTPDGGFVVAADRRITKLSPVGDVEWVVRHAAPARRDVGFAAIAAMASGELLAVGTLDPGAPGPEYGALLARLDALGGTTPACPQLVPATVAPFAAARSLAAGGASPIPAGAVARAVSLPSPTIADLHRFEPCECARDPYEPDDGCGGSWLDPGTVQDHDFCAELRSEDWVALDACAGETHALWTSGLGPAADTVLELYAPDCATLVARDDDSGGGRASRIDWTAPADGTYHLRVFQSDGSSGPGREYRLGHDVAACAAPGWIRQYLTRYGYSDAVRVRVLASGNFLVAATTSDDAGQGPHLLELDPSGIPLRGLRLQASAADDVADVIETRDGGFALAATVGRSGWGALDGWVVKLDAAWNVVWSTRLDQRRFDMPIRIVEDDDLHLLVAGYTEALGGSYSGWVVYLRPDGGIEWQETLDAEGAPGTCCNKFVGAVALSDGFLLCGETPLNGWLARIDRAGALLWDAILPERPVVACGATPWGGILVASWQRSGPPGTEAWLGECDASGTFYWQASLDTSSPDDAAVGPTGDVYLLAAERIVRVATGGTVAGAFQVHTSSSSRELRTLAVLPDGVVAAGTGVGGPGFPAYEGPIVMRLPFSGIIAGCDRVEPDRVPSRAMAVAPLPGTSSVTPGTAVVTSFAPVVGPGWAAPFQWCRGDELLPPLEVSPSAAAVPLKMVKAGRIEWEDGAASGSDTFNLYRGDLAPLRAAGDTGACLESAIAATSTTDPLAPSGASAWVYHVSGVNLAGEGPLRLDRAAVAQLPTSPCP